MAVPVEEPSTSNSRPVSNGVHYLAKCVLRGSAVLQVVRGHIRSSDFMDVVFGKETSLELVIIGEDGVIHSAYEQAIFGTIKDLAILRWNEKFHARNQQLVGKDLLVVISDSGKLSILSYCNEMNRFFAVTHVQISSPGNSRHEVGRMLAVDSKGCFIAATAYEDRLALFSISMSSCSGIIDKRIFYPPDEEGETGISWGIQRTNICGTIWSMCFISTNCTIPSKEHHPVLAILINRRGMLLNELLLLEWNTTENEVQVISQYAEAGSLAHSIVEVPHYCGFAFLFRVGDAVLMDLRDPHNPCCIYKTSLHFLPSLSEDPIFVDESCKMQDGDDDGMFKVAASALLELKDSRMNIVKTDDPMSIDDDNSNLNPICKHVCSWSWDPQHGKNARMIVSVDTGDYFMVEVIFDSDYEISVNISDCLYQGQPSKALLWVEGGFVAALIEMGDGMVLKLENDKLQYISPVQNIAPILDMSVVENHDEKHNQMFACCGMAPEGSLRIIRSGISVEKLLRTAPIYQGITGLWTIKMKVHDPYHSFLVLSFVEETRVLKVGLNFTDVTDMVGFQPNVCTLACGLVGDGLLVQIHQNAVTLCLPTSFAHPEGISLSGPISSSWVPHDTSISLGAVAHNLIVIATSNPCVLFFLGLRLLSSCHYEIYEMQTVKLQNEVSCIFIPQKQFDHKPPNSCINMVGTDSGYTIVIGTHKPSVEVLSFDPGKGLRVIALGTISLTNTEGTTISGGIPQDVRLVVVGKWYVLSGLRNGMLLRFEWPALDNMGSQVRYVNHFEKRKDDSPVHLQLIASRRIGITPVFLVPISDVLDANIIALSDRPWILQTARHSLSYTSISFQPSTHVTPVCSAECPEGVLFVADNSLHLVEMVHSKRLNVQKFYLGSTPRKVLYHSESRLLLVMRTELNSTSCLSDICCVDPLTGFVISSFKLDPEETGKSMDLVRIGNEQVLVVGTSLSVGPAIMPSGEAESTKGRLIFLYLVNIQNSDSCSMSSCAKGGFSSSQRTSPLREIAGCASEQLSTGSLCSSPDDNNSFDGIKLEESEQWQLRLAYFMMFPGMVLAVCPYLDRYLLASAGNAFFVCGFPCDNPLKVRKLAIWRTRFMIMSLATHGSRIAVGDCRDGILLFTYREDAKKLEQLYCDRMQRLVADCVLTDSDTAVVSDRKGTIAVLSCPNNIEDNASPECNLKVACSYYMGEIAMRIRKGSFKYKLPVDDVLKGSDGTHRMIELSHNSIIASTLLGSIVVFVPLSREEHELLEAVQAKLVVHPLTAPILGNDHNEFRSRESSAGTPKILDGDMLVQFLELTSMQQEAILSLPLGPPSDTVASNFKPPSISCIPVNMVVRVLERIHYALS